MQNLTTRMATDKDYDDLCSLYEELDRHHVEILPYVFKPFDGHAFTLELLLERNHDNHKAIFVAEIDGCICGFAYVEEHTTPDYPMFISRKFALLDNLLVKKEFRGLGVAKLLFSEVRSWAKKRKLSTVRLKVYSANIKALEFYKSQGISPLSEELELEL
jgi:ribosomal protein S18 acetylase RimI-like enzyme